MTALVRGQVTQRMLRAHLFFQCVSFTQTEKARKRILLLLLRYLELSVTGISDENRAKRQRLHSQHASCCCPEVTAPRHGPQCLDLFFSLTHTNVQIYCGVVHRRAYYCRYSVSEAGPLFSPFVLPRSLLAGDTGWGDSLGDPKTEQR